MDNFTPAECKRCGYGIVPEEIGHELHPSGHWSEPTTTGWVHNPAEVGTHWHENYDTRGHEATPKDNRTVIDEYKGAKKLLETVDTYHKFHNIVKNTNLGRQWDGK